MERVARVAVSDQGRVKPWDSLARSSLLMISGKRSVEHEGQKIEATEWLFDTLAGTPRSRAIRVFRVDHPDVKAYVGKAGDDRNKYSLDELMPHANEIVRQAQLADQVKPKQRDPFQRESMLLYQRLNLYQTIATLSMPYLVPPDENGNDWRPYREASNDHVAHTFTRIVDAYRTGDVAQLDTLSQEYESEVRERASAMMDRTSSEVWFNRAKLFTRSAALYVLVFLFGLATFFLSRDSGWRRTLCYTVSVTLLLAFVLQTTGLFSRIYLQGRPPVTNLYSSAIFIGWAGVPLGYLVDRYSRFWISQVAAAVLAFATLIVAHNLGSSGDTMQMMQAVLDSNFWLATHVIVITIAYTATFFAGLLGIAYIALCLFTKLMNKESARSLARSVYGMICIATFLSFVGTVLGGIWADQSWGRFWGWDPKENGAALIVIMNLIILHARWGGMIRDRGLVILAIVGNVVTAWSWFGTNLLGVGLHSYGFSDSGVFWLAMFMLSQLIFVALGLIPVSRWRSDILTRQNKSSTPPAT
jgi:ABC-type transport system involved in cytochrome c biogenesis permease subunit